MTIGPVDRRGLGETIAWTGALVMSGLLCIVSLLVTKTLDPHLSAQFGAVLIAVMARGTERAGQRTAVAELRESAESDTVKPSTPGKTGEEK